jgi:hypothetical protein
MDAFGTAMVAASANYQNLGPNIGHQKFGAIRIETPGTPLNYPNLVGMLRSSGSANLRIRKHCVKD